MIVPRSSKKIIGDNEYSIFSVTLFRRAVAEFKNECSKRKFIVREFNYSAADIKSEKEQQTSLSTEKSKTYPVLFKWLKVNFSEAFSAWLHIKALRIFVESVLRYGLPVNFRAAVLIPSKPRKLRERLNKIYSDLDSADFSNTANDGEVGLKFDSGDYYPYVYCRIPGDVVES